MSAFRHFTRTFRRNPGVLSLAVLTLALGTGSTTAVFKIVDALLIRPLPYPGSDRLFEVWTECGPKGPKLHGVSRGAFHALRDETSVFSSVEAYQFGAATLTGDGEPVFVAAPRVTPGLLHLLGAAPRLGRLFDDNDSTAGSRVAIISEHLWTSRFGRAPDVINRRLTIDDEPHTIVGVLPRRFGFPEQTSEVWRPILSDRGRGISERAQAVVMLRAGITREVANDRLVATSTALQADGGLARDRRLVLDDLIQRRYGRQFSTALYIMLGAIALVLLVACVNVANLLLARAITRQSEFALMGALGASRSHLVAQVLGESLALAALGAAGGVLIARVLLVTILDLLPPDMKMLSAVATLDWRAVAFAASVATLTCVVVGVLPALRVAGHDPIESLKGRLPGVVDHGSERWQSGLVAAQLAVVLVLLTGTGLLLRSFTRLVSVDPGFAQANLLVFEIQLPDTRYQTPGSSVALLEGLDRLVEAIPGVGRATFAEGAPPTAGGLSFERPEAEGRPNIDASDLELPQRTVTSDYFATMGIPIVEGRSFIAEDPENVVIVNDKLARRLWGGESPVGRRFRLGSTQPWRVVVGVARDVKEHGLHDPIGDGMEVYFAYSRKATSRFFAFIVRATGNEAAVVQQVKERLWTIDERLPILGAMTMEQRLGDSVAKPRFLLRLASAFAGIAIVLACVGVYGTAAYWVARRRRELGIRMALGATRRGVLALIVGRSVRLAAWGCTIGLAASLSTTRILSSLMFETSVREPAIMAAVTALLVGLVLTGCYVPARRASQIDPATVLRSE
jgi:putative ABC transport system permease protein